MGRCTVVALVVFLVVMCGVSSGDARSSVKLDENDESAPIVDPGFIFPGKKLRIQNEKVLKHEM
jgi:hypothetical protein